MSEAPYVLDGLYHHVHQTDLRIAEHYTDTAGGTDHVFGLCHLLGFRFSPRIKDLKDRKGIVKLSRFGRDEVQRARFYATAVALRHCAAASDRKIRRVARETRCR